MPKKSKSINIHFHKCPCCMRDARARCEQANCIFTRKQCAECTERRANGETSEQIFSDGVYHPKIKHPNLPEFSKNYPDLLMISFDEWYEHCTIEESEWKDWKVINQKCGYHGYVEIKRLKIEYSRKDIAMRAFEDFSLIAWHSNVNVCGIFIERKESYKFSNNKKENVIVEVAFSEPLKKWFHTHTYNYFNGSGGSGISLFPYERGCDEKEVAIFFALLAGRNNLAKTGEVHTTATIDRLLIQQFDKIKMFEMPEFYADVELPEFLF